MLQLSKMVDKIQGKFIMVFNTERMVRRLNIKAFPCYLIGITSKAENPAADRRPPSKIEQGDCPEKIS
jgi:hypothetical protein